MNPGSLFILDCSNVAKTDPAYGAWASVDCSRNHRNEHISYQASFPESVETFVGVSICSFHKDCIPTVFCNVDSYTFPQEHDCSCFVLYICSGYKSPCHTLASRQPWSRTLANYFIRVVCRTWIVIHHEKRIID